MGIKNIKFDVDLNDIFTKEEIAALELRAEELGTTLDALVQKALDNITSNLDGVLGSNITEKNIDTTEKE